MTEERRANNADWPEWLHRAWQLDRETPGSLYPTEEGTGDGTLSIGTLEAVSYTHLDVYKRQDRVNTYDYTWYSGIFLT